MKKVLCVILAVAMLFSCVGAVSAEDERVEISFKVGDSTLMINGSPVTVETPYIVGVGTTLVPLRVITEAFGATVTWVAETQEILLDYPEVSIVLQIGNKTATVNSHTETLPEPPVLSPAGVTMVPLRFISETFGAAVGYDEATASITVVKEAQTENIGGSINGTNDKARIGDSYYGWSMNTPKDLFMTDREFDGSYTEFSDGEDCYLIILIGELDDDFTYDTAFSQIKERFNGTTLIQADKTTDEFGNSAMHFKGKSKEEYTDIYEVFKDNMGYMVIIYTPVNAPSLTSLTATAESFKLSYGSEDETYDLSSVDDEGYRLFTDEDMKISFKVPAACTLDDDTDAVNSFYFGSTIDGDVTSITCHIYSKSDTVTASSLASKDNGIQRLYGSPTFVNVTNLFPYDNKVSGVSGYYYAVQTLNLPGGNFEIHDIFIEKGDYVYNMCIKFPKDRNDIVNTVMNSFTAELLDKNTVGILLENDLDRTSSYTSSYSGRWELTFPLLWAELSSPTLTGAKYMCKQTGAILSLSIMDGSDINASRMTAFAQTAYGSMRSDFTSTEENVTQRVFGNKTYQTFCFYDFDEESQSGYYITYALTLIGGKIYSFMMIENAIYHGGQDKADFESVLASLKVLS